MWLNRDSLSGPSQVIVTKGWSGTKSGPDTQPSAFNRQSSAKLRKLKVLPTTNDRRL